MKRIKKLLAVLLSVLLLASLLPTGVMAAGENADWATSAVTALEKVYGTGMFSNSTDNMKEKDLAGMLGESKTGWTVSDKISLDQSGDTLLTRSKACKVLAEVFSLDISSSSSAIKYLYDQNIINGTDANGTLNENGPVSHAEFAVLTYRVLNAVGGGMGSDITGLKPGTDEYYAWLYLVVRYCIPFDTSVDTLIKDATIETYVGSEKGSDDLTGRPVYRVKTESKTGQEIWNAWVNALKDPNIGGDANFSASDYNENDTLLQAATKLIRQFTKQKYNGRMVVFHDVTDNEWFYDGIMYLADRNYTIGYGDGQFGPDHVLPRFELAVLLARVDGFIESLKPGDNPIKKSIEHVVDMGYMSGDTHEGEEDWNPINDDNWKATATREEATVAILKMIEETENIDTTSDNLAILDRFTDKTDIAEASKPYLAYAVSMGLLSGTSETTLNPHGGVSRAQAGVLLYRTLIGVDQTKMKDYRDNVSYVLPTEEGQATQQSVENTQNTFAVTTNAATFAEPKTGTATLTLREDWRLTSDLDLNVPEGTTLTIQGNGNYIYEMGGKLLNSGLGKVVFENTILYPAEDSKEATKTTSDQLMMDRQPHKVTVGTCTNGAANISQTQAKKGDTVTVTVTPDNGYELDSITVTTTEVSGITVTVSGTTFTMPASDVTVTATFKEKTTAGGDQGGSSGGGVSSYPVKVEPQDEGSVEISSKNAQAGAKVTLTSDPKPGYRLRTISVLDGKGASVDLTKINDGTYEFVMPSGSVTVKAEFEMIPPPFEDTSDQAWYYEAVHYVYYHKIMTGTGSGEFSPNATLSRAMVAQILYNLEGQPTMTGEGTFVDAAEHWAADAIAWAKQTGVVAGYEGNIFRPEKAVTREELAQMLYNYAQYKGYNLTATGDLTVFPDGDMVQDWAETAMSWANGNKLINGSEQAGGNLILSPNGNTTRAEAASILMNFDLNLVEEE